MIQNGQKVSSTKSTMMIDSLSHDSSAWTKTQPKPVFRSADEEEEKKD
jgi:hypothetical protein